jgi:hypothetical protein
MSGNVSPTLKRKDTVIMDNLPAHKVPGIREAIEAVSATLRYLPQYLPDLNPIEMVSSKLKAFLQNLPSGPSLACVEPSAHSTHASAPAKHAITLGMQVMRKNDRNLL